MQRSQYKYTAFISYKHEDLRWAQWIQRKIETYHAPKKVQRLHDEMPESLSPVFLDQTNLRAGVLLDQLQEEIASAKYLIVVCSKKAHQNSKYLDVELEYFLKSSGDISRVIPVIVDESEHPELECYPEKLCELGKEKSILGVNIPRDGKRMALLKILSYMYGLQVEELESAESRRKRKRIAYSSIILCFLLSVSLISYLISRPKPYDETITRKVFLEALDTYMSAKAQCEDMAELMDNGTGAFEEYEPRLDDIDEKYFHKDSSTDSVLSLVERMFSSGSVVPWSGKPMDRANCEELLKYADSMQMYEIYLENLGKDLSEGNNSVKDIEIVLLSRLIELDKSLLSRYYATVCEPHLTGRYETMQSENDKNETGISYSPIENDIIKEAKEINSEEFQNEINSERELREQIKQELEAMDSGKR